MQTDEPSNKKKRFCSMLIIKNKRVIGIRGDKADVVRVTIPRGVIEIAEYVFGMSPIRECSSSRLTSVILPDTLTSIESDAFDYCIPGSLGRPTLWVSRGCNSLCREDRAQALSS